MFYLKTEYKLFKISYVVAQRMIIRFLNVIMYTILMLD